MTKSRHIKPVEIIRAAIEAYSSGAMTSIEASKHYGVPQSTIRNHHRRPLMNIGSGRRHLLTKDEETFLVQLLLDLENNGFRLTKQKMLRVARNYVERLGKKSNPPGRCWLTAFIHRNSDKIQFIMQRKLERYQKERSTEAIQVHWFDTLYSTMHQNNLLNKPEQIFAVDECVFKDKAQRDLVLVHTETKAKHEDYGVTNQFSTTLVICTSAKGDVLPPFTIYPGKNIKKQWIQGGPKGSSFKCSPDGCLSDTLFLSWFNEVFLVETTLLARPLLLILDDHPCHFTVEIIEKARENNIIILCLPSDCIHNLNPLDFVYSGGVKDHWRRLVTRYFQKTHRKKIRKIDYPKLLKKLFEGSLQPHHIEAGFAHSGICPYNREAMKAKRTQVPVIESRDKTLTLVSENVRNLNCTQVYINPNSYFMDSAEFQNQAISNLVPAPITTSGEIETFDSFHSNTENISQNRIRYDYQPTINYQPNHSLISSHADNVDIQTNMDSDRQQPIHIGLLDRSSEFPINYQWPNQRSDNAEMNVKLFPADFDYRMTLTNAQGQNLASPDGHITSDILFFNESDPIWSAMSNGNFFSQSFPTFPEQTFIFDDNDHGSCNFETNCQSQNQASANLMNQSIPIPITVDQSVSNNKLQLKPYPDDSTKMPTTQRRRAKHRLGKITTRDELLGETKQKVTEKINKENRSKKRRNTQKLF